MAEQCFHSCPSIKRHEEINEYRRRSEAHIINDDGWRFDIRVMMAWENGMALG